MIDPLGKEKEDASRRGFIRKAIAGVFGATILSKATDLFSIESKTGYTYIKRNGEVINHYTPQGTDPYIGQISLVAFGFAPVNWLDCDGKVVSINNNQGLYALIGDIYGGDGLNIFSLPDLRGRVPIHQGNGIGLTHRGLGQSGGAENIRIIKDNLPPHSHKFNVTDEYGDETIPGNTIVAAGKVSGFTSSVPNITFNENAIEPVGKYEPVNIMQPFLALRYCISMAGIFPTSD